MNGLKKTCCGLLLIALITGTACSSEPQPQGEMGDFKLQNVNGSWVQLSDYKGKKAVMLYFWATWCPACIDAKPRVAQMRQKIGEDELEILAVNVGTGDSFERVRKYQEGHPMPWPVLYDKEGQVSSSYGVQGIPLFILMNKEGKVVYRDHAVPENPRQYLSGTHL